MSDAPAFRYGEAGDAEALRVLIERAYRDPANAGNWDSESHLLRGPRTSLAEVEALLADANSRIVIAERNGRIDACALIQRRDGAAGATAAYFGMFAVDPDARGSGLGAVVLAECERRAAALWCASAMVMTVISVREALIGWYERRGYARTGARQPFPFSETSGALRRDFDMVELAKPLV